MDHFLEVAKKEEKTFAPMGDLVHKYSTTDAKGTTSHFSIYKVWVGRIVGAKVLTNWLPCQCTLETPGFIEFHRRLQVLLLWYIDGASFINEDDDRWQALVV